MKKNFFKITLPLMLITAFALNLPPQKDKKDKPAKAQNQKPGKPIKANEQGNKGNQGNKNNAGNKQDNRDNSNNGNSKSKENRNNGNNGNDNALYSMKWNRDNYKDRKKIKDQKKVTICHKINRTGELPVSLTVSENAVKAHLNHGDVMGECPVVNDRRFSNIFLRNRTDYYNLLENTQGKAYYSRSILDYALERLTTSRSQLAIMRNNNLAAEDIQRKEATVVELEQNVSLLQTLLNVAVGLVASRLQ